MEQNKRTTTNIAPGVLYIFCFEELVEMFTGGIKDCHQVSPELKRRRNHLLYQTKTMRGSILCQENVDYRSFNNKPLNN